MRARLEHKIANRTASESKTTTTLDVLLQKLQTLETKFDQLQQQLQEQRKEVKDMGEKRNGILTKMQTIRLQFDLLSAARDTFDVGNVEGAQWNLQEKTMDAKTAPQTVSIKEENKPVSSDGTTSDKSTEQPPLFGTTVPPKNPPFSGALGSSSFPLLRKRSLPVDLSSLQFLHLCKIRPRLDPCSTIVERRTLVNLTCPIPPPNKNAFPM